MSDAPLSIQGLTVTFGGVVALNSVDLELKPGVRYGVLGPNGSGKTTLFNAISGLVSPTEGRIVLFGNDVTRKSPHARARMGLGRTFQITALFRSLSVLENVEMAARVNCGEERDWWQRASEESESRDVAKRLLTELDLGDLGDRPVASLGYGEQRQVEIAVTLAMGPKILLLDEPTAGLSAVESAGLVRKIQDLPDSLTILIIEHDLNVMFDVTSEISVLFNGESIAAGTADHVRSDPVVRDVYLGT